MAPRGGRGGNRGGPLPRPVQVSKKLSSLLRHNAEKEGLQLDKSGYVNVLNLLNNRQLKSLKVTFAEIQDIVKDNDKQRFTMIPKPSQSEEETVNETVGQPAIPSNDPKDWIIRANQGHSLPLESEELLKPITVEAGNIPETVVHGTTHSAWHRIVSSGGLKPMNRNHIHFAAGLPSGFTSLLNASNYDASEAAAPPVISGMRNSSTILIFVNIKKAMEVGGIKFWISDNGVILSEGNAEGLLPLEFCERVEDRTGEGILVKDGRIVKDAPEKWKGKGKGERTS